MRVLFIFLFSLTLFCCNERVSDSGNNKIESKKKSESDIDDTIKPAQISELETVDFIEIFDAIYQIEPSDFFTLKEIDLENAHRHFALALNHEGLKKGYTYGVLTISEYQNHNSSKNAFNELLLLVDKANSIERNKIYELKTNEGFSLYYEVLSKSGSIFILKDQFIIHKLRRCNDNYKENELKEEQFLKRIFQDNLPEEHYFIRSCCSCPKEKGLIVK